MPELKCRRGVKLSSSSHKTFPPSRGPNKSLLNKKRPYKIYGSHARAIEILNQRRRSLESRIQNMDDLAHGVLSALGRQTGFSMIRLGDAEILVLAQDLVFPTSMDISTWGPLMAELSHDPLMGEGDNEVQRWRGFLQLSEVNYPDLVARDLLIESIRAASTIGVPVGYRPGRSYEHIKLLRGFQALLLELFDILNLSLDSMHLVDSAAHYYLFATGWLHKLLFLDRYPHLCLQYSLPPGYKPRFLLIGNQSQDFHNLIAAAGCTVVGSIQPVGFSNLWQAIAHIQNYSFEIALVSAGISAKYICTHIASKMNKIALDTGHLFDVVGMQGTLDNAAFQIPFNWLL